MKMRTCVQHPVHRRRIHVFDRSALSQVAAEVSARKYLAPGHAVALEALAIIAYKQPITKPEVDHIRGVDLGYIVRQLLEKDLVEVAGRADRPGRPLLYKTTKNFLKHFGINSVEELPKPREINEILQDDDMSEHRQIMLELKAELSQLHNEQEDEAKEDLSLNYPMKKNNSKYQSNRHSKTSESGESDKRNEKPKQQRK